MSKVSKKGSTRKLLTQGDPIRDKIVIARKTMLELHPFFGTMAMYLQPIETDEVETLAVTGDRKLLINRKFVEKASTKNMVFFIAHETMHLVTDTHSRRPLLGDPTIWNYASDIAINYLLLNQEHGAGFEVPTDVGMVPLYADFQQYWGKSTEAIYYDMIQNAEKQGCKSCSNGDSGQDQKDKEENDESGNGNPSEQSGENFGASSSQKCKHWFDDSGSRCAHEGSSEEEKEVWKRIIQQSAEAAKQAGNCPGFVSDFVTELTQPKKNWKRELQYFVSNFCRQRYDWKVRNKRTAAMNILTPGKSPYLPQGVCGIDTSGSMSDDEIRMCVNEHAGILTVAGGEGKLGLFDCELYHFGDVNLQAITNLPVQRGGTDFRPFFERIETDAVNPAYVVLFTDLCGPWPEEKPSYPVIICRTGGSKIEAPFEDWKVIDLDLHEHKN